MSIDKITEVAVSLYAIAHSQITHIIDFIDKICKKDFEEHIEFDKAKRNKIGLEFMFFFLHITHRMAIRMLKEETAWELKEEQKKIFMNHTMSSLIEDLEYKRKEFEIAIELMLNERQLEYTKYKEFPMKDEGLKDTLLWEFGKHISEAAGYPMNIRLIMGACEEAFTFIDAINWKEWFNKFKK